MIVSLHVTHRSAGADRISDLVLPLDAGSGKALTSIKGISGYAVLRTCNRFEAYVETSDAAAAEGTLRAFAGSHAGPAESGAWFILSGTDSAKHLFRVACGLDSLVVGEDQIQGQVRDAYVKARDGGHISDGIAGMFEWALRTGKRVRSETGFGSGAVSVGSVAAELAEDRLNGLRGRTLAVLGAGETASSVARTLKGKGPNAIFVSSRTYEHARMLAAELDGAAVHFSDIDHVLLTADLLIVSTSAPHILIDKKIAEKAMEHRENRLLIIDISVPRNVSDDVSDVPGVTVETMESIGKRAAENLSKRYAWIADAERIVGDEIVRYGNAGRERIADEVIGGIAKKASEIRCREMSLAMTRLGNGADPEQVFDDFSKALIAKMMAEPYERLRKASRNGCREICEVTADLFGVEIK